VAAHLRLVDRDWRGARSLDLTLRASTSLPRVSEQRVTVEVADHVAVVTLTRPDKHNALDIPMFDGISAAIEEVGATAGVRAVILHGEGKSFCSGLDIAGIMASSSNGDALTSRLNDPPPNYFQKVAYGWTQLPMPVICAIHGNCLGGGLQIALGADIRICAPDARLSVMESKWGLIPDMSITRTLPRLVGIDVAKELTFTARTFDGEEAARLGVVTRVNDEPLAAARQLAAEIAGRSPDAVRAAKRLFDESWTAAPEESLALEAALQQTLLGSVNQMAAVTAGFTKQPPEFVDP
jgi:enoyl-CoA hydratase/carnithine racemase